MKERPLFRQKSNDEKAKKIIDLSNSIINQSGFANQVKYEPSSVMEAVKSGDLSKLKTISTDSNDGFKVLGKEQ